MNQDPKRLIDDPAAPAALRDDLECLGSAPPVNYDAGAGLSRLQAALASGAPATTAATGIGIKLLGLVLVGVVGVGAIVAVVTRKEQPPTRSRLEQQQQRAPLSPAAEQPAPSEHVPQPMPPAETSRPSVPATVPTPAVETNQHAAPPPRRVARQPSPPMAAPDVGDPDEWLRRETVQLADARRLLTRDAAAALQLADAGQREFANGMFAEERAAIAIFALVQLDRTTEASDRAEAFLRRYPAGPFSHRVRALTASPAEPAP